MNNSSRLRILLVTISLSIYSIAVLAQAQPDRNSIETLIMQFRLHGERIGQLLEDRATATSEELKTYADVKLQANLEEFQNIHDQLRESLMRADNRRHSDITLGTYGFFSGVSVAAVGAGKFLATAPSPGYFPAFMVGMGAVGIAATAIHFATEQIILHNRFHRLRNQYEAAWEGFMLQMKSHGFVPALPKSSRMEWVRSLVEDGVTEELLLADPKLFSLAAKQLWLELNRSQAMLAANAETQSAARVIQILIDSYPGTNFTSVNSGLYTRLTQIRDELHRILQRFKKEPASHDPLKLSTSAILIPAEQIRCFAALDQARPESK